MNLTDEQARVVEMALTCEGPLKVQAGAGTGKTFTLHAAGAALHGAGHRVVYLAFNRAIKQEAERKFRGLAAVYTTHGLAYRALGRAVRRRRPGRIHPGQAAEALGLKGVFYGLDAREYAALVVRTLDAFCHSPDPVVAEHHLPRLPADEPGLRDALAGHAQDLFFLAAPDDASTRGSDLPLPHDLYLKYWQVIGAPGLTDEFDVVLLDEAQDSNPVVLAALDGARVVYVGDTHQQIYSFRAAVDAMSQVKAPEAPLTQSFRYGQAVAELANAILRHKRIHRLRYPLRGLPRLDTRVLSRTPPPSAVRIYRTNYQIIRDALVLSDRGQRVTIIGDMSELISRIESAVALRDGHRRAVRDPFIRIFTSYDDLVRYSESDTPGGRELRQVVRILEDYEERYQDIVALLSNKDRAPGSTKLITAHKAKGCEWPEVAVMEDFDQTLGAEAVYSMPAAQRDEELNLLYVAVTRATERLYVRGEFLAATADRAGVLEDSGDG